MRLIVCLCSQCGEEIREGDTLYRIGADVWCSECINYCKEEAEADEPEPDDFYEYE